MEILNRASSTLIIIFQDFNFRGLAVLSRNSRNINASKITRYTVPSIRPEVFSLSCDLTLSEIALVERSITIFNYGF